MRLLGSLQHWWEIYAPWQAVTSVEGSQMRVHPHRGQVIYYSRLLSGKTRQEVAKALHWSPAYLRKIEDHPEGTDDIERNLALIPYLQISPRLLGLWEASFLPDTPDGAYAALMEKITPLLDEDQTREDEIRALIRDYERSRVPSYVPLSQQEVRMLDEAAIMCLVFLHQMIEPLELFEWLDERKKQKMKELGIEEWEVDELAPEEVREQAQRRLSLGVRVPELLPSSLIRSDKIQEAWDCMQTWQHKISRMLERSDGFRRDQLLYAKCVLYTTLGELLLLRPNIEAELGLEKRLDYVTRWLVCAQYLGNVVLLARPLIERMRISLTLGQLDKALEDFSLLELCLTVMCKISGHWEEARLYDFLLEECMAVARGGMKIRLRAYQWRLHCCIEAGCQKRNHQTRAG